MERFYGPRYLKDLASQTVGGLKSLGMHNDYLINFEHYISCVYGNPDRTHNDIMR